MNWLRRIPREKPPDKTTFIIKFPNGITWTMCPDKINLTVIGGEYVEGKFSIGDKPVEVNKEE